MPTNKIIIGVNRFRLWFSQTFQKIDTWTHGWAGIVWTSFNEVLKPSSVITSAAISYFAIFSLFPLILLSVSIASFGFEMIDDYQGIIQKLEFIAPALGQLLGKNIEEIIKARGPVTVIAFISLVWSASTFFFILTGSLNGIWDVKDVHPVWKRRGGAILFVLIFVSSLLFFASFVGNFVTFLSSLVPKEISQLQSVSSLIIGYLLNIALFWFVYVVLPHSNATFRDVLPGAIWAGLLWEFAKKTFLIFISSYLSLSNLIFGSVATIVAIMTWAYLSGLIFLFGAHINVERFRIMQKWKEDFELVNDL
jgi:membrane protein